jgi:hypothetical protein
MAHGSDSEVSADFGIGADFASLTHQGHVSIKAEKLREPGHLSIIMPIPDWSGM